MNLEEIKKLIKEEGKIVIADENGPSLVVMSYEDYKNAKTGQNSSNNEVNPQTFSTDSPVKEQIKRNSSLSIDDLPF